MLEARDVLRRLIEEPAVKLSWEEPPKRGQGLRRWRLVISAIGGGTPLLVLDTGMGTHASGFLAETAGPAIVKTAACLIATLGPRVILPSGKPMPEEWLQESVKSVDPLTLVETKRRPGRPRKYPLPEEPAPGPHPSA
jgi:hypothetical protein